MMDQDHKISVVINTYNASRHLAEVLETVKDFDEVVVCDMESTDDTLKIAHRYGCRIVNAQPGEYRIPEPARTLAVQSASCKWVFSVDADELVTPELREYLYDRIRREDCPAGLYVPRRNRFLGRLQHTSKDYQLRFMIKEGTYWPPHVHARPVINGTTERIPYRKELCLEHLSDETIWEVVRKNNDYSESERDVKKHRQFGCWALIMRPVWRFCRAYFIHGGWRDGKRGLIRSALWAQYHFLVVAKMIEQRLKEEDDLKI